jgi:hypothetical protein
MTLFVILVLLGAALLVLAVYAGIRAIRARGLPPRPLLIALGTVAALYTLLALVA